MNCLILRLACLLASLALLQLPGKEAAAMAARVIDAGTGAALAGATVTIGDHTVAVDAAGRFELPDGTASIALRAPGYRAVRTAPTAMAGESVFRLDPFRVKAVYLSVYGIGSHSLRQAALDLVEAGKVNALVVDLKGDRGLIPFPSASPLAASVGARRITTIPDLTALAEELHRKHVYLIARIVVFKDDPLATTRPDLAVKRQDGTLYHDRERLAWADPFRREVWTYNVDLAVEAAKAGFDEIQFDYVRFPDTTGLRFAEEPTQQTRLKAITGFLAEARRRLLPYNAFLAVDIFGYVCWNIDDTHIGQRIEDIMPLVDYVSPMLYPSGFQFGIPGYAKPVQHPYEIVRLSLDRARARTGVSPLRFRPWLQAFKDYAFDRRVFDADEVAAQIKASESFGSDGWMLWNPRNDYDGAGLVESQSTQGAPACTG